SASCANERRRSTWAWSARRLPGPNRRAANLSDPRANSSGSGSSVVAVRAAFAVGSSGIALSLLCRAGTAGVVRASPATTSVVTLSAGVKRSACSGGGEQAGAWVWVVVRAGERSLRRVRVVVRGGGEAGRGGG